MMVAHNPLHRSGLAAFPHPALASGDDAKAAQRIGMTNAGKGQPALEQTPHSFPGHSTGLTAPTQHAIPEPPHLKPKQMQRRAVHGHTVIADVPTNDLAQPLTHLRNRVMHAAAQLGFDLVELCLQPLTHRLPQHREAPVTALLRTDVREAQKVERLRFTQPGALAALGRVGSERQPSRFLRVQLPDQTCPTAR